MYVQFAGTLLRLGGSEKILKNMRSEMHFRTLLSKIRKIKNSKKQQHYLSAPVDNWNLLSFDIGLQIHIYQGQMPLNNH